MDEQKKPTTIVELLKMDKYEFVVSDNWSRNLVVSSDGEFVVLDIGTSTRKVLYRGTDEAAAVHATG